MICANSFYFKLWKARLYFAAKDGRHRDINVKQAIEMGWENRIHVKESHAKNECIIGSPPSQPRESFTENCSGWQ